MPPVLAQPLPDARVRDVPTGGDPEPTTEVDSQEGLDEDVYVILTGYTSINALVKAELFPASIRALGVGLGYAIANSLFGGTVPLIGAALQKAGQEELFFTYVTVAIGISLLVYIFALKNKKSTHLDHEQGHAWAPGAAADTDGDKGLIDASRR